MGVELYLVRHGKASSERSFQEAGEGPHSQERYDELDVLGKEQARRLGDHWGVTGCGFDLVLCGPMQRQRATLELAAAAAQRHGICWPAAQVLPDAREVLLDVLIANQLPQFVAANPSRADLWQRANSETGPRAEHSSLVKLVADFVAAWRDGAVRADGVETWPEFRERTTSALREVMSLSSRARGRVLLVSSMGVINGLLDAALGLPEPQGFPFRWLLTSSVSTLIFSENRFELGVINQVPHLADAPHLHTVL